MKQAPVILAGVLMLFLFSCKKDSYITSQDATLFITSDTLHFDTVFTASGSVTQVFKILNDNNQKIRLDNITLGGGNASYFKINVDGYKGPQVTNVDIEAKDSLYIFVSVSIDVNASANPFIVRDSIEIAYNGNKKQVQLEAYGQNAHFLRDIKITENTVWTNDLPYVIAGGLTIEENVTLAIEKGCRLFFHADAPLLVKGTLKAEGNDSTRVYFCGDRLDEPYASFPGSWPGIYFRESSKDNLLHFAVIKNSYQGVVAEAPASNINPKLILSECIIDNIYDAGILSIGSSVTATNCLVSNAGGSGSNNVCLIYGGTYNFTHCTVVSYGNSFITHKNPVLYLSNYIVANNGKHSDVLRARFTNCIFWGENGLPEDEVVVAKEGGALFEVNFTNCLWKIKNEPANVTMIDIIQNENPRFDSINTVDRFYNFRLQDNSPAINKGINTLTHNDLDGKIRPSGVLPDLGAYEK